MTKKEARIIVNNLIRERQEVIQKHLNKPEAGKAAREITAIVTLLPSMAKEPK